MVILLPMDQLGCRRASCRGDGGKVRCRPVQKRAAGSGQQNLPDTIVLMTGHALEDGAVLAVHGHQFDATTAIFSITMAPAMTRVSLLARAMSLPASMAARVGTKPADPTMAPRTMSVS